MSADGYQMSADPTNTLSFYMPVDGHPQAMQQQRPQMGENMLAESQHPMVGPDGRLLGAPKVPRGSTVPSAGMSK